MNNNVICITYLTVTWRVSWDVFTATHCTGTILYHRWWP